MRRLRNTKIVATLGPTSSSPDDIEALFAAGVDVFRLNFSHGLHDEHKKRLYHIRQLEKKTGRPIGVLMDLQGPKLRLGTFAKGPVTLRAGDPFRLDLTDKPGTSKRAPLPHKEVFSSLKKGTDLLLDDGKVHLRVEKAGKSFADTLVITGGKLSDRKGVNIPNALVNVSAFTDKDLEDLQFGVDMGVDWVALSFVQRPEDIRTAIKLIDGHAGILTKLEKPMAIEKLDEIIELSDAIMVARGDLGVEVPLEEVPILQKRIIRACRKAGKPVVVATQMLDSMIHAPAPTRAEASDVATAVYDGADAVMLSAETAAGDYPIEAVKTMDRIIHGVERDPSHRLIMNSSQPDTQPTASDAISTAAAKVAETVSAAAIVTYSKSGATARRVSRERPAVPILSLSAERSTTRQLSLAWGVHCVHTTEVQSFSDMVAKAIRIAKEEGFAKKGDHLVVTAGVPFGTSGATNILRVADVSDEE